MGPPPQEDHLGHGGRAPARGPVLGYIADPPWPDPGSVRRLSSIDRPFKKQAALLGFDDPRPGSAAGSTYPSRWDRSGRSSGQGLSRIETPFRTLPAVVGEFQFPGRAGS